MNKIINCKYFLVLAMVFTGCYVGEKDISVNIFTQHCGSCHLPPNPTNLPKNIWRDNILPDMGARLGIVTPGFDPYENMA